MQFPDEFWEHLSNMTMKRWKYGTRYLEQTLPHIHFKNEHIKGYEDLIEKAE